MSVSPSLLIHHVTVGTIMRNHISIPLKIVHGEETVETKALLDSGAGGMFIDQNFTQRFPIRTLDHPLKAFNGDGTENKTGMIWSYVDLEFAVDKQKFTERLYVTGLGRQKIILGFPWLNKHNPKINWKTGKMEWNKFVLPKYFFLN